MDDKTYSKAHFLKNKLDSLLTNKKILSDIIVKVPRIIFQDVNTKYYRTLEVECLDFDKIKSMLLQEINKQIEIAQKEFEEL